MGALAIQRKKTKQAIYTDASLKKLRRVPLDEASFAAQLTIERRRAERSDRAFALMLAEFTQSSTLQALRDPNKLMDAIACSMRMTDTVGWILQDSIVGVILTEFGDCEIPAALEAISARISTPVQKRFTEAEFHSVSIRFRTFPHEMEHDSSTGIDLTFYPEVTPTRNRVARHTVKRAADVVGSAIALTALSPLLLLIAAAVRLTSRGPAIFRQERIGSLGMPFVMYKFRTMHDRVESHLHEQFVESFIHGETGSGQTIHKIANDPRVTALGRFLRKTSLDELPQLFNVLRGEMSMVGPRPPLPYEVRQYQSWHKRRVLEAKPGLTGLWQVTGRSKTRFDEMVRLDLRYANNQSFWLDLWLLLRTARVLISDEGAC